MRLTHIQTILLHNGGWRSQDELVKDWALDAMALNPETTYSTTELVNAILAPGADDIICTDDEMQAARKKVFASLQMKRLGTYALADCCIRSEETRVNRWNGALYNPPIWGWNINGKVIDD